MPNIELVVVMIRRWTINQKNEDRCYWQKMLGDMRYQPFTAWLTNIEYWSGLFSYTVLMYIRAIRSQWACVAHTRFHISDWLSRVTLSLSASCFDLARLLTCLLRPRLASQSWDCVHLAASDDNLRMVELYTILSRYKILFLEHGIVFLW